MPTYLVKQTFNNKQTSHIEERLVEAPNKATAIRHVASDTISAEPCDIADAMRLAKAGTAVEKAGE